MASNESAGPSSSSVTTSPVVVRPEAEPLPSKIGEIGYVGPSGYGEGGEMREISLQDGPRNTLHPADRSTPTGPAASTTTLATESSLGTSTSSKRSLFSFFHSSNKTLGGVYYGTIARLVIILSLIGGTTTCWVLVVTRLDQSSSSSPDPNSRDPNPPRPDSNGMSISSSIFLHVAFAIGLLFLLLFLERVIFQARAERYNYLHPGSGSSNTNAIMAIAPWNRPPLPTYAAALAGRGTGDVEDHIIAQPPPPAYGNTRGSVLLLSNLLRNSLRSISSRRSQASENRRTSRPMSYGDSEEQTNAQRAVALEATLARLEEGAHHQ